MNLVRELLDDAIALQKDGLSPGRIGLALADRWEAEQPETAGEVRRTADVLRGACAARSQRLRSSLTEAGRGGLPQDPNATIPAL